MKPSNSQEIIDRTNEKIKARSALYDSGIDFTRILLFFPVLLMPILGYWLHTMKLSIVEIFIAELGFVGIVTNFIQSWRLRRQLRAAIDLISVIDEQCQ